jgi:hypothetical protein
MHLVNILRIITFSCLERHSNFNNSDFNSFRVFWDTLYSVYKKNWTFQIQISYNEL